MPTSIDVYKFFSERKQDFLFEIKQKNHDNLTQRYSIIGLQSDQWFIINNERVEEYEKSELVNTVFTPDPINEFLQQTKRWKVPKISSLPTFLGVFFGFFNTECTKLHQPTIQKIDQYKEHESHSCAIQWLTKNLIILDHTEQNIYCITHLKTDTIQDYVEGYQYLASLSQKLEIFLSFINQSQQKNTPVEKINLYKNQDSEYKNIQ